MEKTLLLRSMGFIISLLLTLLAYFMILSPASFHLQNESAINFILILGLFQSIIQFLFFLDLWREEGPLWNLSVFVSTVSIIFIVVFFSIWIMAHLDYMIPK